MEHPEQHVPEPAPPEPAAGTAPESTSTPHPVHYGRRKVRIGRVVSDKPQKTIVVAIERNVMHPVYKKTYKRTTKVMAHDEHNQCRVGDIVKIVEWRPLSRRKRWMLVEILQRSHQLGQEGEL
uniref:Small ribosomal subunit protein uS17 n=1 Tax=uncultured Chlorobiota bacterium TaxID=156405 RepID=H5SGP4_9BACT|nr:30S ribosomal protein S17 [uncultured Chlorobiota bacterium]